MIKFKNNTIYPTNELIWSVVKFNQITYDGLYKYDYPLYKIGFKHSIVSVIEDYKNGVGGRIIYVYYVKLCSKGVIEIYSDSGFEMKASCKVLTLFNLDYNSLQEDVEILET